MRERVSDEVQGAIVAVLRRYLPAPGWRLVLFGSFARGQADRASDIDLAVCGPEPLAPALAARIEAALEAEVPMLRRIDLVDLRVAPASLRRRVEEEGVSWNEPDAA